MSQGKYSPRCPHARDGKYEYKFNCYGKIPLAYDHTKDVYDEKLQFGNYDDEGFDSYGYSAFDIDGNYMGIGEGVDRLGYTEMDYLSMSEDDYADICMYG
jgi:hypothetical protein